jgi:hypothetical protein
MNEPAMSDACCPSWGAYDGALASSAGLGMSVDVPTTRDPDDDHDRADNLDVDGVASREFGDGSGRVTMAQRR